MRSILDRYFEMLSTIVAGHGGRVEKFIGDAVLAVFGLPRVHEDDPLGPRAPPLRSARPWAS